MENLNYLNNYELKVKKVKCSTPYGQALETSEVVAQVAAKLIGDQAQEHFIVLATNTKNEVIGYWIAAIGSISSCPVDMRSVFRMAVVLGSCSVVVCHNHPSGSLVPSPEDLRITEKVRDAAKLLDLMLLDHIIVSGSSHYSMRADKPELFR